MQFSLSNNFTKLSFCLFSLYRWGNWVIEVEKFVQGHESHKWWNQYVSAGWATPHPGFWTVRRAPCTPWGSCLAAADCTGRNPAPPRVWVPWHHLQGNGSGFWSMYCCVHSSVLNMTPFCSCLFSFPLPGNFLDSSGSVTPGKKGRQEFECEFPGKMKFPSSTRSRFLEAPGITSPQIPGFLTEWNLMLRNDYHSKIDAHPLCAS